MQRFKIPIKNKSRPICEGFSTLASWSGKSQLKVDGSIPRAGVWNYRKRMMGYRKRWWADTIIYHPTLPNCGYMCLAPQAPAPMASRCWTLICSEHFLLFLYCFYWVFWDNTNKYYYTAQAWGSECDSKNPHGCIHCNPNAEKGDLGGSMRLAHQLA